MTDVTRGAGGEGQTALGGERGELARSGEGQRGMDGKVTVEICCGTACYLLGAAKLMDLELSLPPDCRDRVDVGARTCLGLCERENLGGAPYVRFNGAEVMAQATPERVTARILELVEGAVRC